MAVLKDVGKRKRECAPFPRRRTGQISPPSPPPVNGRFSPEERRCTREFARIGSVAIWVLKVLRKGYFSWGYSSHLFPRIVRCFNFSLVGAPAERANSYFAGSSGTQNAGQSAQKQEGFDICS